MRPEDVEKLPPYSGNNELSYMGGKVLETEKLPYEQLVKELTEGRFMEEHDPMYYHIQTFWAIWHDEDFGSNQAVFHSIGELCQWIEECGGFTADDLFIVEELSSIRRR